MKKYNSSTKKYDTYYSEELDMDVYYTVEYESGTRYDNNMSGTPSSFEWHINRVTKHGTDILNQLTAEETSKLYKEVDLHIEDHAVEYMYESDDDDPYVDDKVDEMRMNEYDEYNERD